MARRDLHVVVRPFCLPRKLHKLRWESTPRSIKCFYQNCRGLFRRPASPADSCSAAFWKSDAVAGAGLVGRYCKTANQTDFIVVAQKPPRPRHPSQCSIHAANTNPTSAGGTSPLRGPLAKATPELGHIHAATVSQCRHG